MTTTVKSEDAAEYKVNLALSNSIHPFTDEQQETIDLAIKYITDKLKKNVLNYDKGWKFTSPEMVMNFCKLQIGAAERELFGVLFLNNRHTLISFDVMFQGTIDGASVHPREILKRALELNAAALILAHNHPSGDPSPSSADQSITDQIMQVASLFDVRVLDHIIVGTECVSFAETGRI